MATTEQRATFGAALKNARNKAGLSQRALGAKVDGEGRVGVSGSAVGQWEDGTTEPTRDRVFRLEELLGVAPGSLSVHLGYRPKVAVGSSEDTDCNTRIAHISDDTRRAIDLLIEAEEAKRAR